MTHEKAFIYGDSLLDYHFHEDHPFDQQRVLLTKELLESYGSLRTEDIIPPRKATETELNLFHEQSFIEAVKKAGSGKLKTSEGMVFGLGTGDTPTFPGMHTAASNLVGGTLTAVDTVMDNRARHALHLGGGLHHGFRRQASGFCVYNDGAVAIEHIRKKYQARVLYVDTDAHHGDGVQWAFYDDPDVCTFSIHETGRYLFPGTGNINERGIKNGHGYAFNLPIDAFTEDASFLDLFETAMHRITRFFQPDIIITQNGVDAHAHDPLTHICLSMDSFRQIPAIAHELAHIYCSGRWVALGGGGYDMWRVVPRAWGQIWNEMKENQSATGNLPINWLEKWQPLSPVALPETWDDDISTFPEIPRRPEITEKNKRMLEDLFQFTDRTS